MATLRLFRLACYQKPAMYAEVSTRRYGILYSGSIREVTVLPYDVDTTKAKPYQVKWRRLVGRLGSY
jgi:hypothetical protein